MTQAQEIQDLEDQLNWHWRNSMRTIRFFSFDVRAAIPLPLLLVYARPSTLVLSIVTLLFFRYLERKGLTFPAAIRTFRTQIVALFFGRDRPGYVGAYYRRFKTFR